MWREEGSKCRETIRTNIWERNTSGTHACRPWSRPWTCSVTPCSRRAARLFADTVSGAKAERIGLAEA